MNLEQMLKYQELDISLRKLNDEIERSEYGKKLELYKSEFNAAKQAVSDSEKNAESMVTFFNNALKYFEENGKRLDELDQKLKTDLTEEERRETVRQLETLKAKFAELDKKLAERRQKSEKVLKEYVDGQHKGKNMREKYAEVKDSFEAFRKSKEPAIKEIEAKLAEIRPTVDPALMQQYAQLTAERKYPAVVRANGDIKQYTCGGCGLALSQKTQSELIEKNICRCDTCRRIIYKPEDVKKKK